ncbi:MAG: YggS family pyridoxal phosphate-dependent enzyme [Helicobacteraceae bacterium]|nr:YggS family pyridoxal phosphate-dependent enzyme [Helicobacteraceae bacterium]
MDLIDRKLHLDKVIERIEFARVCVNQHHIVKTVAISKYSKSEDIKDLYEIGVRAFGENKVQDLETKSKELEELPLEWHFVGSLQKNKINKLIALDPYLCHSLDSLELALALDQRLEASSTTMNALLQINSANETTKSGVSKEEAKDIYQQISESCKNINLKGVMSIGAHSEDEKLIRKSFQDTYKIYDSLDQATICSMGMSGDFEEAIRCGSNMVRLGSILFK